MTDFTFAHREEGKRVLMNISIGLFVDIVIY